MYAIIIFIYRETLPPQLGPNATCRLVVHVRPHEMSWCHVVPIGTPNKHIERTILSSDYS